MNMHSTVKKLVTRVEKLEAIVAGLENSDAPCPCEAQEPEVAEGEHLVSDAPVLRNQAGEEITRDEEVPGPFPGDEEE